MSEICVNGEQRKLDAARSLAELLLELGLHDRRVAVMVNDAIVRREERERTRLSPGDRVEIIQMVGGG